MFFLYHPNPYPGAGWRRIESLAGYLRNRGYSVTIAGAFTPKSLSKAGSSELNGVKIINITPVVNTSSTSSVVFNILSSLFTSFLVFLYLRPKLVIISVPLGETALGSYLIGRLFGAKIVFDYRDLWEDYAISTAKSRVGKRLHEYLKEIMTRCYQQGEVVTTVTDTVAQHLLSRGITKIKVLPNGADTNIFKPYDKISSRKEIGFHEGDFILTYSGTIGVYYRLDLVIKALKIIIDRLENIKLLMVGDGPDLEMIRKLSKEMGLHDKIIYFGAKDDKKILAQILSASDVGLVPYDANPLWKSALPAKVFEYFACGLPVIATVYEDSTLAKLICNNRVGLISEPDNADALAEEIKRIYTDSSYRIDAGNRASLLVKKLYDRNKTAEMFFNLVLKF